jgi:hypothetical protein
MTYPQILHWFNSVNGSKLKPPPKDELRILNKSVPGLRYLARPDCAKYYEGSNPELLSQKLIKAHILKNYEYDAIDISKIMHELAEYVSKHQTGGGTD